MVAPIVMLEPITKESKITEIKVRFLRLEVASHARRSSFNVTWFFLSTRLVDTVKIEINPCAAQALVRSRFIDFASFPFAVNEGLQSHTYRF
jgi:hypothetical protein